MRDGISELRRLIDRLNSTQPLSFEEGQKMRDTHSFDWSADDISPAALKTHRERYRARAGDIAPLHGEFLGKIADQDLLWNVIYLGRMLDDWFTNGHSVPPHWATRICVLLRKAKRFDLEREFLASFIPHYATPYTSAENTPLIARAVKIGAL